MARQPIEPKHVGYAVPKAIVDGIGAAILLTITSPVILLAAFLVKLTSHGPAFYCQTRLGKNGRPFKLIKLRTMVHNAEALTGPVWATENDARITRIGRFLRSIHLDEFPQLINVLLGQMSLVGPRPERPEFTGRLELELPQFRNRVRVRPGITGLAQLLLPPDSDLKSVRKKLVHDLYYVRYMNPWLDVRILTFTASYLAKVLCYFASRPLALPNLSSAQRRLSLEFETEGYDVAVNSAD